ncbi:hypothetical protein Btru_048071 [Bulinus truncatus]|nr:hypothetical protein Btru_048071 [Bulinus truncatus]
MTRVGVRQADDQSRANVLTSKEGRENSSRTPTFSALKYNPCEEVKRTFTEEAPVTIYTSQGHKELLCDTETDGGRWLYIQASFIIMS